MDQVRTIEAGALPARFARGWHCLGLAARFRDGGPHAVAAFGTKLVVFADSSGALHVLDAYCRHMGGDLSQGTVKGDAIACPFHDWRWGGDGRCAGIPYARRVPVAARTRAWRTLERNGHLFVWNDPEGNAPPDDVTIPVHRGRLLGTSGRRGPGTPSWSRGRTAARSSTTWWTWRTSSTSTSRFPTFFKNVFEGHIASQYLRTRSRPDVGGASNYSSADGGGETTLRSEASYYGPAYMIDYLWHDYHGMGIESVLINCHYPVTPTSFLLQWGAIVRRPPGLSDAQASRVAAKFADFVGLGFQQDVEIWLHKTRIDNPLLCAEDGPVYQVRRWYEQFYRDVADVEPDMVARFEFEIDTTRAVAGWEAEVAANLARADSADVG